MDGMFERCLDFLNDVYRSWFAEDSGISFISQVFYVFSVPIRDLLGIDPDLTLPDFVSPYLGYTLFGLMFNVGFILFISISLIKWVVGVFRG